MTGRIFEIVQTFSDEDGYDSEDAIFDEDDDDDDDRPQPQWPSSDDLRFSLYYDDSMPGEPISCTVMMDLYDEDGDPWDQSVLEDMVKMYPDKDFSKVEESAENSFVFEGEFLDMKNPDFPYETKEEYAALFEKTTGIKFSGQFDRV